MSGSRPLEQWTEATKEREKEKAPKEHAGFAEKQATCRGIAGATRARAKEKAKTATISGKVKEKVDTEADTERDSKAKAKESGEWTIRASGRTAAGTTGKNHHVRLEV